MGEARGHTTVGPRGASSDLPGRGKGGGATLRMALDSGVPLARQSGTLPREEPLEMRTKVREAVAEELARGGDKTGPLTPLRGSGPLVSAGGCGRGRGVRRGDSRSTDAGVQRYHPLYAGGDDFDAQGELLSEGRAYRRNGRGFVSLWCLNEGQEMPGSRCMGCCRALYRMMDEQDRAIGEWAEWAGRRRRGVTVNIGLDSNFLEEGGESRHISLPYSDHSCGWGEAFIPHRPSFGGSAGHSKLGGLAQHSLQFRLFLGLNVPRVRAGKLYSCEVPVRCELPVDSAPALYWGSSVSISGRVLVSWAAASETSCPFEVLSDSLVMFRSRIRRRFLVL